MTSTVDEYVVFLREVTARYPGGEAVVRGVTFGVKRGERVAVIGANGAGKTTLLLAVAGLIEYEGEIYVDGVRVTTKMPGEMRRKMGFLFQNPSDQIIARTVMDDVSFGPRCLGLTDDEIKRISGEVLRKMELEGYEDRPPFQLSLGEQKKVAIAGILAAEPEIFLMDEPDGGLDPYEKSRLVEFLSEDEKTIVFTSHDMDFTRLVADRCLVLFEGKIVRDGGAEEVLSDKDLLESCRLELPFWLQGRRNSS